MADRYLDEGEKSPQEAFARVACAFSDDSAHAQRLYDYVSNCWFMFATPVLANGGTSKGMPISCFLNKVDDSREGLGNHYAENLWLSTSGGGIGTDWSGVRSVGTSTSKGNQTTGVVPFIKVADSLTVASWQGSTRRGATAVYLSVSHPEIEEFVEIRKPTGDANRRSLNIHNAITISDAFMQHVESGEKWDLIDPHTNKVVNSIDARDLWMKILAMRVATGEPFLFFEDTANKALPKHLKDKGLRINHTNLCTEIMLPTAPDRTAVCCLSSVNLEFYDEWSQCDSFIEDLLRMLDNVLQCFVQDAPDYMWRAVNSAKNERSVGLGAMGFHLFLQKKGVPFEGVMASSWNARIFKHIKGSCDKANYLLGEERGEAPDAIGTGLRFSHTNAIAPNANSSVLCGNTSPAIEPFNANAFTQKTLTGVFLIKNKALSALLETKYQISGKELDKIWQRVILEKGSVQHLDFLSDLERDTFKTAMELDQNWVIEHASVRQPYIDQAQSINLYIEPTISKGDLHKLHKSAWAKGLKSLYYCRAKSIGSTEIVSKNVDNGVVVEPTVILKESTHQDDQYEGCLSCEG
jgi:ribonucleoside-diphosphate reductase alpha chain